MTWQEYKLDLDEATLKLMVGSNAPHFNLYKVVPYCGYGPQPLPAFLPPPYFDFLTVQIAHFPRNWSVLPLRWQQTASCHPATLPLSCGPGGDVVARESRGSFPSRYLVAVPPSLAAQWRRGAAASESLWPHASRSPPPPLVTRDKTGGGPTPHPSRSPTCAFCGRAHRHPAAEGGPWPQVGR